MNRDEQSSGGRPEHVWQSEIDAEDASMNIVFTREQLDVMSRSRERESAWSHRILLTQLLILAGAFTYNVLTLAHVWLRLAQAWLLLWSVLLMWHFRNGPRPRSSSEPCAVFLQREYEKKRDGSLQIRRFLFLLLPPILLSVWTGGPAMRLRSMGVSTESPLYAFAAGWWPLAIMFVLLGVIWLALGHVARKAARELAELRQRTQP